MNITILGAGAWGTALAILLSKRHNVMLWGRNQPAMAQAAATRVNSSYLPGFTLPDNLNVTANFEEAVAHSSAPTALIIVASSVSGLRSLAEQLRPHRIPNIVWLCKGLEEKTQLLPHQIVHEVLGDTIPAGVLSGPSFAQEVARGLPCGLTIASKNHALCERVVHALHADNLRIYSSDDVIGVEIGGAVKNILAIATGIADGLHLGLNARAALITRGLAEMTRLGVALGGRSETFMGLSGVGDLILTCTGDLSRNRRVGLALAEGKQLETIVAELGHVAEGVRCAHTVRALSTELGVDMPIANAVAAALFDGSAVTTMVKQLLARDARDENLP
jgi:glycerol-3-phosphate dehydrogenase (NAD(P)+)